MLEPRKYAYIDALRGLAIIGVLMIHISYMNGNTFTQWRIVTETGRYGVQLFYLVSALTLMMSLHARREEHGTRNFFLRRFFRIAPAFYVAMVIHSLAHTVDIQQWAPKGITWSIILSTLTFSHGLHPYWINAIVPGGWSVAVEFSFYCILPLLVRWITTLERAIVAVVASVAIAYGANLLHAAVLNHSDNLYRAHAYYWLPNQLPVFMLGVLSFFLLPYLIRLRDHPQSFAIASALLLLGWFVVPKGGQVFTAHIYFSLAFACLTAALLIHPFSLLVNRTTIGLGKISFSVYLTHTLIINLVHQVSDYFSFFRYLPRTVLHLIMGLVVLLFTLALSVVMYRFIETPGINLGRRIIGWLNELQKNRPIVSIIGIKKSLPPVNE